MNLIVLNFGIICLGIFSFFAKLTIRVDEPNKPVSKGSSGWEMFWFNEAMPRNPANRKIIVAGILFSSLKIMNSETKIKINGMKNKIIG